MKFYPLDQCAFYKVNSKRRLSEILGYEQKRIIQLSADDGNFNVFEMPESTCVFTGKKTKARWVQNPKPELKSLHRRIQFLLGRIEVPAFCHGGTKGKSYRTNAAVHQLAPAIATFDLRSFFPSTSARQVAPDELAREVLAAKLGGLLGEAAYIDSRYKEWAEKAYAQLAEIKARRRLSLSGFRSKSQFSKQILI